MKQTKRLSLIATTILTLLLTSCSQNDTKESLTEGGMKCGAGKCGASMANGSALLLKKKQNILDQMQTDDNRRQCVLEASTTKILYDCVRVHKTGRLSTKCNTDNTKVIPKKVMSQMKCESGKCSSGM